MSNETIALLSARRSVAARQMQAPAPSDEELNTLLTLAARVPDHGKEWEQVLSAGAVCMNLVVAANAMGFATSWITEWYAYDRRVLEAFGLAANERVAGFVHIGTASEKPADRPRPELSAIVTRFDEQGR